MTARGIIGDDGFRVGARDWANSERAGAVRAQKKVSKGLLKPPPKLCRVVTDPQV